MFEDQHHINAFKLMMLKRLVAINQATQKYTKKFMTKENVLSKLITVLEKQGVNYTKLIHDNNNES